MQMEDEDFIRCEGGGNYDEEWRQTRNLVWQYGQWWREAVAGSNYWWLIVKVEVKGMERGGTTGAPNRIWVAGREKRFKFRCRVGLEIAMMEREDEVNGCSDYL
ncbi:Hypothetical predicted protein [Olea europaea subsp. europaea]|uniref:Uncharacterized protein n=1 Tax=Olea europaea subsp. europaea TaxID=158383 RepID=A0A8S0P812_OLEEU|nr:Hypothetical predicted protein [Olea europaea subsp. europaea]